MQALNACSGQYQPPHSKKVKTLVADEYETMMVIVKQKVGFAKFLSIAMDAWTQSGMAQGYMGFVAQFYDTEIKTVFI